MAVAPGDKIGIAHGVIDVGTSILGVPPIPGLFPEEEDPRNAEADRRFDRIDARFDRLDGRIDDISDQIGELDETLDALGTELLDEIGAVRNTVVDAAIADAKIIARGAADKLFEYRALANPSERQRQAVIEDAEDALREIVGKADLAIDTPGAIAGFVGMLGYVVGVRLAVAGELEDGAVGKQSLRTGLRDVVEKLHLAKEQLVERFGDTVDGVLYKSFNFGRDEEGGTRYLQRLTGELPDGTQGLIEGPGYRSPKDTNNNPSSAYAAMRAEFEAREEPNLRDQLGGAEYASIGFDQVDRIAAFLEAITDGVDRSAPRRGGTVEGTDGSDLLRGMNGDDTLLGRGDDDVMHGGDGDDVLRGGNGADLLLGVAGRDTLLGGRGGDGMSDVGGRHQLVGAGGADQMAGNGGADRLLGGGGRDDLRGGGGRDVLLAGRGNDTATGGSGHDRIEGGGGRDALSGAGGNGRILGGGGRDVIIGGVGRDRLAGVRGRGEFVFDRRDGRDVVTDFEFGTDTLTVQDRGRERYVVVNDGEDTRVEFGATVVILRDVDAGLF